MRIIAVFFRKLDFHSLSTEIRFIQFEKSTRCKYKIFKVARIIFNKNNKTANDFSAKKQSKFLSLRH